MARDSGSNGSRRATPIDGRPANWVRVVNLLRVGSAQGVARSVRHRNLSVLLLPVRPKSQERWRQWWLEMSNFLKAILSSR